MNTMQWTVHSSFRDLTNFSSNRILQTSRRSKKSQAGFRNLQFLPYEFVSFFETKKSNEKRDENLMVKGFR